MKFGRQRDAQPTAPAGLNAAHSTARRRSVARRLRAVVVVRAVALTALVGGALLAGTASAAVASTAPVVPVSASVTSDALDTPLDASQSKNPDFLRDLVSQVNWLAGRRADAEPADLSTLGPRYMLLLTYSDGKKELYDLYPYSTTGPYIYIPATQPNNRKITPSWHIGRISMVDMFCDQGVSAPGSDACKLVAHGQGAGAGEVLSNQIDSGLGQWRSSIWAIGGGAGLIGVLIFMITLRTHRRTG